MVVNLPLHVVVVLVAAVVVVMGRKKGKQKGTFGSKRERHLADVARQPGGKKRGSAPAVLSVAQRPRPPCESLRQLLLGLRASADPASKRSAPRASSTADAPAAWCPSALVARDEGGEIDVGRAGSPECRVRSA